MTNQKQLVCWLLVFPVTIFADTIPRGYYRIASQYQIPASVLYAAALTESGKTVDNGVFRPWPWTLNVAGKARRFASRNAACQALTRQLARGIRSIDIGLMQINWRWNHTRLRSPCRALSPYTNLHHGAALLKAAYSVTHSWAAAVGHYHSPGQKPQQQTRAKQHSQRYLRHLTKLSAL
ncbi:MAG: transglycosylase SLT domain-containing protein [Gammaproteobacteria bacterium]|nr:transglycosylase SLT domain-containing protein [Gammaproteobacteria bacterium]